MKFDAQLPLGALQAEVDQWIADYGVRYFNELTNMAQLSEEVGEDENDPYRHGAYNDLKGRTR